MCVYKTVARTQYKAFLTISHTSLHHSLLTGWLWHL